MILKVKVVIDGWGFVKKWQYDDLRLHCLCHTVKAMWGLGLLWRFQCVWVMFLSLFLTSRMWPSSSPLPMPTRNSSCRVTRQSKTLLVDFYRTYWALNDLPAEFRLQHVYRWVHLKLNSRWHKRFSWNILTSSQPDGSLLHSTRRTIHLETIHISFHLTFLFNLTNKADRASALLI